MNIFCNLVNIFCNYSSITFTFIYLFFLINVIANNVCDSLLLQISLRKKTGVDIYVTLFYRHLRN